MRSVTSDNVKLWRKDVDRLTAEIADRELELSDLRRRLEAAGVLGLLDDEEVHESPDPRPERRPVVGGSLPSQIVSVLQHSDESLAPPEIKRRLLAVGIPDKKLGRNNSYFYVVLKRLVEQGKIKKRAKKYRCV